MADSVMTAERNPSDAVLPEGTRIDVRNRFIGGWSHGFAVAAKVEGGYIIRRISDDTVLPDVFADDDVRPELHKRGMWWY